MTTNSSAIEAQQLNPLTPMAFLPPDVAHQMTIAAYVAVGSVGVFIWDVLSNVGSEYRLLFRHKITVPTGAYILSRASVLVFVVLGVLFETAPLPNCQVIQKTVCILYHIAFSSTSFLFFLRVRAIFNRNRYVVAFFFLLWLGVLGGSLTVATVGHAVHLGPTQYCSSTEFKSYISAAPITFAVNDTFVFLAISWRLLKNDWGTADCKRGFRSTISGEYLPTFSKALLQDGQVYYFVSVTGNTFVAVINLVTAVPSPVPTDVHCVQRGVDEHDGLPGIPPH